MYMHVEMRRMNGARVLERFRAEGDVLPTVYQELGFWWLPRFVEAIHVYVEKRIRHPCGKDWYVVFLLDYQPGAKATGRLLIRPALPGGRLVPYIPLAANRPLTVNTIRQSLKQFVREVASGS